MPGSLGRAQLIPGSFEYHRPADVAEAAALLARLDSDARVLAGGHSLIPMMRLRMAQPSHLVDLGGCADLKGIRVEGGEIVIGAMTTQARGDRRARRCSPPRRSFAKRRC